MLLNWSGGEWVLRGSLSLRWEVPGSRWKIFLPGWKELFPKMLYCSIFPMCLTKFWFSGSRVHRLTSEPYREANDNSSLLVLGNPGERWVCLNADYIRLVNAICIYTQLPEGHRFVMFCLWCSFYFHPLPKSGGYISCSEDEGCNDFWALTPTLLCSSTREGLIDNMIYAFLSQWHLVRV